VSAVVPPPLILASASPRRRDLLTRDGYCFTVVPAGVTEIAPPDLTPAEVTLANARLKAQHVAERHDGALVLGVDTVVALEGEVFGKPRDLAEALAMLRRLSGRVHEVWSSGWLVRNTEQTGFSEVTRVRFRPLAEPALRAYLERIDPLDKAGAYAAQDDRGELIEHVEGCVDNVVGLPMKALARALRRFPGKGGETGK